MKAELDHGCALWEETDGWGMYTAMVGEVWEALTEGAGPLKT